ncbi:MAG: DHH family phosphoesterase [Thermoprotei archaeon]|nr:MAG: DHH family phosphoesterase [Thermoprotei archaeon]
MLKNKEICDIICAAKSIAIVTHKNADPDAFFSAYALSRLITILCGKEADLYFPESISAITKRAIKNYSLKINYLSKGVKKENYDLVFIVDTGSPEQLGEYVKLISRENVKIVLIDHHFTHEFFLKKALLYVDPEAKSTAELIYLLFKECNVKITKNIASLLLIAILYDTRQFSIARPLTFKVASELLEIAKEYRSLASIIKIPMDIPEKVARLKASMRMDLYRAGEYLIAITNVGAYEASAARALLDLGADVAFVISENKAIRVSARAKHSFTKQLGVHLGKDVMVKLGKAMGGTGGGHDVAAGAEGKNIPIDYVKGLIVEILSEIFRTKGLKLTALKP